ncbi:MAG: hypothetical protein BWY74_00054 [Firmicutes bacterium ADurb.Bin419]|nr:MAG: hypothetical protein BWY74_00054 [Firmicutes bacterium ADurb.Bin419]
MNWFYAGFYTLESILHPGLVILSWILIILLVGGLAFEYATGKYKKSCS